MQVISSVEPTCLASLAAYADGIGFDSIPAVVRRQAVLTMADTVACMISGLACDDGQRVLQAELARGGEGDIAVVGTRRRLNVEGAARVNAYLGDIHELNDLTCGHSGIGNVAAVLAMGEAVGANGPRMIEALCAGIEVTSRIYSSFYPTMKPYTDVGMVSVGPAGSAGAAAACAKLMGMDAEGLLHAMANALAQAGWCPAEAIFGAGGSVKPLLFGSMPAAAGIIGALYARQGITGPTAILEGQMGYLRTVAHSHDLRVLLCKDRWHLEGARRKLHACCGYVHSAMDTLIALRQAGVRASDVAAIRVYMPGYIIPAICKQKPPRSPHEARFHGQLMLSLAFLSEDVILPQHSDECGRFLRLPEVRRLMKCIEIVEEPAFRHYHFSRVELFDCGGAPIASRCNDAPKGSAQNPLSDAEIWHKLRRQAPLLRPEFDMPAYVARLAALERETDATGWIVGMLN